MTITPGGAPAVATGAVPRWFARLVVVMLALVAGYGGVGLLLAVAGRATPVFVAVLATPVVAGLVRLGWSLDRRERAGRGWWPIAALALAVASVLANAPNAGEHVIVNRDPGVYLVTGRWIADHGTLTVDAGVGPFGAADDVVFESSGTYDEGGGRLDFQFNHLLAVLLAQAHWLGGDRLLVAVPVLIGAAALLTTYALAARLTGRDWAGFLVAATLSTSLPVLAAVRDTYSEPAAWLLLTGGLWAWTRAADEGRVSLAALGGLVLGAVAMVRIDAIVYLLAIPIVAAVLAGTDRGRRARLTVWAFVVGVIPGIVIGTADLVLRSREYYRDLRAEVLVLWGALVLTTAAGLVVRCTAGRRFARRAARPPRAAGPRRRGLATGAGVAVVVVGALAWFVRPDVQQARTGEAFEYVGAIQAAEGQPVEPDRRYDERSLQWMAWYLGPPTVALAIVGGALIVRRSIHQQATPAVLAWLVLASGTALYLWRPSITPDHIWASRRFVPAALPLLATLAAVTIVAVVDAARHHPRNRVALGRVAGGVLALAVVGPVAVRAAPVASLSDQHGYLDLVDDLCAEVTGGAVLVVADERAGITLPQTLRSFCDVPVGLITEGDATPARVAELAQAWAEEGRPLHMLGGSVEVVGALVPAVAVTTIGPYRNHQALEVTVTRPPGRLNDVIDAFYVAAVPAPP